MFESLPHFHLQANSAPVVQEGAVAAQASTQVAAQTPPQPEVPVAHLSLLQFLLSGCAIDMLVHVYVKSGDALTCHKYFFLAFTITMVCTNMLTQVYSC